MATKKRYAQVGVGDRSYLYSEALVSTYRSTSELVAICDTNPGRLALRADWARERGAEVKTYLASDFDRMIAEIRPDTVIVTSKDCTHDEYICRAMELGCDVISEKPMTTDEHKCQRILDTRKATGRRLRVTFNYRYSPPRTQIKELLMSGVIGEVVSLDFHWLLNTVHGADYFRRWHRNKTNTGGLQVHKATHHFDLINWWLSSVPERIYATGARNFYRPETADRYGLTRRTERCLTCPESTRCPFFADLRQHPHMVDLYLKNEAHDGYFRDRCVFSKDIDIEDTLHLAVDYRNGAQMSYSLHAFMPWEGHIVTFNGTKGRLEHVCQETVYTSGDGTVPGRLIPDGTTIRIYPHFQEGYSVPIWQSEGGHGGGDPILLEDLFSENPAPDKFLRSADERAGAWSILTGISASRSMEWKRPVRVDELVHGLVLPDYPAMPDSSQPIDPTPMKSSNAQLTTLES
jgi:predicted dehydrogenase